MCNLLHTCYLCLTVDPQHKSLIPLYDRNREETQRIRYVLPELVLLGPEPDVRPFICYMCVETLTSFYLFKRKCLENNYHLMCILNKQLQHPQQRQLQQQQLQKQILLQQQQQQEQLQQQNYQQQLLQQQQQQQKKQIQEKHQQQLKQLQRRHEQQQQLNNVHVLQLPQQRHFETRPDVNFRNSIINPNIEQHTIVQNKPTVDVTKTVANVAPFDCSTGRNYLNLTEKQTHVEKRAEPVLNNEFIYYNLQMQDPSPLSANQINSVDRNNVVTQLCNDKQAQQKEVEIRSRVTENVIENELSKVHTPDYSALYNNTTNIETNVHLTKNGNNIRTQDVETLRSFCDSTNDKQLLTNEPNGIAKRTSESPFDAKLECKNQETQDSFIFEFNLDSFSGQQQTNQQRDIERSSVEAVIHNKLKCPKSEIEDSDLIPEAHENSPANNIDIKENFGSIYNQLQENVQKDSEKKLDAVIHNELKSPKLEVENSDLIPEAQKNARASNIDIVDNFEPFYDQQLTNEQKDIERKKLEAFYNNELQQYKLEFEDSVSVSEAQRNVQVNNIDIKENFDHNRQVPKQDSVQTKRLEEKFDNKLKDSKPDIEDSMMLDQEQLTDDIDVKENIVSFYELTNKQKYIETRRLEEIYQNELKCSKQKIEDLDLLSHKYSVEKNNSHTQQVTKEQNDFKTRKKVADEDYLPSTKTENEDSDSFSGAEENNDESFASFHAQQLSDQQEDSETRDVSEDSLSSPEEFATEDFIIKEEFVPYYSTGTKFYQELENNLRSVPITNNPLLSVPSSETNIVVNNIFMSFYNSIPGSKPYNTNKWNLKNSDKVKCPICAEEEVVVLMPNHLRWHVAMKHFDRIKCSICKAELLVGMMHNHRKFHSQKKVKSPIRNKVMLMRSYKRHKHTKPTKCAICHKQFTYVVNFETHKKMHVEEWRFECKICNKKFFLETHLKSHTKQAHTDNKFECNICNKILKCKSGVIVHQKFHEREPRTYKCSYCGQMFVRQTNLMQHEKIHVGVKEYECATCGKKFLHKSHLKQHVPTHAGLKKFECSICNKVFLRKCSLSKHMETHPK